MSFFFCSSSYSFSGVLISVQSFRRILSKYVNSSSPRGSLYLLQKHCLEFRQTDNLFPKMDLYIKGFIGGIWGEKRTFATFTELLRLLNNQSTWVKPKYIFGIVHISSFYPCFYIQNCIYGSWEKPHQSHKNGEIFVSGCKFLRFFA